VCVYMYIYINALMFAYVVCIWGVCVRTHLRVCVCVATVNNKVAENLLITCKIYA